MFVFKIFDNCILNLVLLGFHKALFDVKTGCAKTSVREFNNLHSFEVEQRQRFPYIQCFSPPWSNLFICRLAKLLIKLKLECKGRAEAWLRVKFNNTSIEYIDNHLRNDQSKTNSLLISGLGAYEEAKLLEELFLVIFADADACICDAHFDKQVAILSEWPSKNLDATLIGELESIREQVENHLLQPVAVCEH